MSSHADLIRTHLAKGPLTPRQLIDLSGISQPTLSRALTEIGDALVRIGAARSIQYALRDEWRGLQDFPVFRVDVRGQLSLLGTLIPVRPDGFVMLQEDGKTLHSAGLPWWLYDMRPQGYLGRAYVGRHATALALPAHLNEWSDTHAIRALLVHGHDAVGNLLLGDLARDRFLSSALPSPLNADQKASDYVRLAREAASGDMPGSSAGGEQPKFTAYVITPDGPRHVIVKFSETEASPVSERWRDLLLAEHLALQTLGDAGISAARSRWLDHNGQRFLEVERFDRSGALGRRGLKSLAALDAEFVGSGNGNWPTITRKLAAQRLIAPDAARMAELLWAFGTLIGNTDMHNGNLSFIGDVGRPYQLAPAYDMTPMGFRPTSGGALQDRLNEVSLQADVSNGVWQQAQLLTLDFLDRVKATQEFSARFAPCIASLSEHLEKAAEKIRRLA
jgi:hypothetical protein